MADVTYIDRALAMHVAALATSLDDLAAALSTWENARRVRRTLERLRDRRFERWRQDRARDDEHELDEANRR